MKPAVAKKVREIKGRVRDLRASYVVELKASKVSPEKLLNPDARLIPRVTGLVVREGNWLVRLVKRQAERGKYEFESAEADALADAELFFGELAEVHADEITKNGFLYRLDAAFVTHLEKLVLLAEKIDAQVKARVAAVATIDDDEGDDEALAAEIEAEMTA